MKLFAKKYPYHVVYYYKKDDITGIGSCTSLCKRKIKTDFDLASLKESIENDYNNDCVVILNYILVKERK